MNTHTPCGLLLCDLKVSTVATCLFERCSGFILAQVLLLLVIAGGFRARRELVAELVPASPNAIYTHTWVSTGTKAPVHQHIATTLLPDKVVFAFCILT